MCSFILDAGGRSHARKSHQEISNMDKCPAIDVCFHRKKADEFGILAIATINGLFVFHLQVINKVDEQYSAN